MNNNQQPINNIANKPQATVPYNQIHYTAPPNFQSSESYFDGGLLQLIGWYILGGLVTMCTLGICYPWSLCMIYGWEINHTVVNGHRMHFDGKAIQLFGNWIKWLILTFVTCGIRNRRYA